MSQKPVLIVILVLALVTLACGIQVDLPEINIPIDEVNVGPTQTENINVPVPLGGDIELRLEFGAGELKVRPGSTATLVEGTASYNVEDFKPKLTVEGSRVELATGDLELSGIPKFEGANVKNEWDLLISSVPMALSIQAGAYQGEFELGGLALNSLNVQDGAADVELVFSAPNTIPMEEFRYNTGASQVTLSGLANANFEEMTFRGGAGSYRLDFSGVLQRDASVRVESGVSQVTIVVPAGTAARVQVDSRLTNVESRGVWEKSGDDYVLEGSGPELNISVILGAGSLILRNVP